MYATLTRQSERERYIERPVNDAFNTMHWFKLIKMVIEDAQYTSNMCSRKSNDI